MTSKIAERFTHQPSRHHSRRVSVGSVARHLSLLTFLVLASCSNIEEADRLQVVNVVERDTVQKPDPTPVDTIDYFAPTGRHVLIEDFTGQDCVNCPNATDLIAQLQDMQGHDKIIAVGIHSGPLGVKPDKDPEGLATTLGDTYYKYWNIEMQPYGVINRSDGPLATDWWTAKVNWDLAPEQPDPSVNIWVTASADDDRKATINTTVAAYEYAKAKLQIWLVEDGIVAFQKMPDGTKKADYVHNHVLRDAVNGAWGEDFELEAQDTKAFAHSYDVPANWNMDQLYVVAFAYNDDRVIQAARKKLTK